MNISGQPEIVEQDEGVAFCGARSPVPAKPGSRPAGLLH